MRCGEVQKHLNRFHDAELPRNLQEEVERHLASCAQCRATLARMERVAALWGGLARLPVPEGLAERVMLAARHRVACRPARNAWRLALRTWWCEQSLAMRAASAAVVVGASTAGVLLSGNFAQPSGRSSADAPANAAVSEGMPFGSLSGAPGGSLEQTYLAWTLPSGPSRNHP